MLPLSATPKTPATPSDKVPPAERERLRADQVKEVVQVKSAGAHWGIDCERVRRSFFDRDEVRLSNYNFKLKLLPFL